MLSLQTMGEVSRNTTPALKCFPNLRRWSCSNIRLVRQLEEHVSHTQVETQNSSFPLFELQRANSKAILLPVVDIRQSKQASKKQKEWRRYHMQQTLTPLTKQVNIQAHVREYIHRDSSARHYPLALSYRASPFSSNGTELTTFGGKESSIRENSPESIRNPLYAFR